MIKPSQSILSAVYDELHSFAKSADFWSRWQDVFGLNASKAESSELRRQWRAGDFSQLPAVAVVAGDALGTANAAYAASVNQIYVNESLIQRSSPETIIRAIIEEIGHFVDVRVNKQDTAGDEGEAFAAKVLGITLSPQEQARIATEEDRRLVVVGGQSLEVEQANALALEVTTLTDENDGSATVGSGLSLRDALMIANANHTTDIAIRLSGGLTYELRASGFQEDRGLKGDLDIQSRTGTLIIEATGSKRAILDASNLSLGDRVFDVLEGGLLSLSNLTITGGNSADDGGGIRVANNGILAAAESDITGNISIKNGSGIYSMGTAYLRQVSVSGNILGSGIYNAGNLLLINSTVAHNEKEGIDNFESLLLINSTINNNGREGVYNSGASAGMVNTTISSNGGIGVYNINSAVTLSNCTVTNNVSDAENQAGGIHSFGSSTSLRNTIVAGNRNLKEKGFLDVSGQVFGNNNNLIGSITGGTGSIGTGTDRVNVDPALTPLQNNGGLVLTHALLAGSAALNAGNNARVILDDEDLDQDGNTTETIPFDARGPGFARLGGNTVDIGAVEARGVGIPSLSIESATTVEGDVGQQLAIVTLRLNVASEDPVSIDFTTAEESATAGADYRTSSGTIQFEAGEVRKDITIPILGDDVREADENLLIQLKNPINTTLLNSSATLTIVDNEPSITLQSPQDSALEGDGGSKNVLFTVTLSKASRLPVTVNYATADETATAGSDYTLTSGTLTFAPGETSRTIAVPILGDEVFEGTVPDDREETFQLQLSSASVNAAIANATATARILDDEPTIAMQGRKIVEGNGGSKNMLFPVTLSKASNTAVQVNYSTANGTAVAGKDYGLTSGRLTFAPGEVSKTIPVPILGDQLFEESTDGRREEKFQLLLSAATPNAALATEQVDGIIVDTDLPATELVSPRASDQDLYTNNYNSQSPSISGDGRYVVFESTATNLVPNDTNNNADIFLRDRLTGQTRRVSVSSDGTQSRNSRYLYRAESTATAISADGRWITFVSNADNLVPGDNNDKADIFLHDRVTAQTTRVSVGTGGIQADGDSASPAISEDGRFITFSTNANNLWVKPMKGSSPDIFVHDRITGATTLVSRTPSGQQISAYYQSSTSPAINASGRFIAYVSAAEDLVAGDTNNKQDIFVFDQDAAVTTRVSVATGGGQANATSDSPSISADGRYVVFRSDATTLVSGINGGIFLHDRQTGQTTNVVVGNGGAQGNGPSRAPRISSDGRYVVYESEANNLVPDDTNSHTDIFRYDIQTGQTRRVSVSSDSLQSNDKSKNPAVSANGRYIAFQSDASALVSTAANVKTNVFVHDSLATEESPPLISVGLAQAEVREDGVDDLVYTFSREGNLLKPLTAQFRLTGTATVRSDYTYSGITSLSGDLASVTFATNSATTTVRINPTPDTTMEADETVIVSLVSGSSYAVATLDSVSGVLKNDDLPTVTLAVSPRTVPENDPTNLTFTFRRTGILSSELTVPYTIGGTAGQTSDYTGIPGGGTRAVITFAAGSSTAILQVDPSADNSQEGNETVSLTLAPDPVYKIGTTTAVVGTIMNDDFIGTSANNTIRGSIYADYIDGGAGADALTGGTGSDRFHFRLGQSKPSGPDRITDFQIGNDRILFIAADGSVLPAPSTVTRAADHATAITTQQLCQDVFADADGSMTGKQALGAGQAALVVATNSQIAGTYIIYNDVNASLSSFDTMINIKGYTGTLPGLGSIAPSLLFG